MIGRDLRLWLLGVVLVIGGALIATERAQAVQFGTPSGGGLILCQIGTWRVNQCLPPPEPQCEEVLGLTITSVMNGNRLETQTFTGSELTPRHPVAAGARYNSGTGRWEDPNNPSNFVTFAPDIRLSHKTCAGQDPQFGAQELSHNTMPVDPGHSVDISVTVTCSNCNKQRLTAQIPVDTVTGAQPSQVITPPPPILIGPPPIWKPTPISLTATPQCTNSRSSVQLTWTGGQGASTVNVWRGGSNAGSAGGWEKLQTYSGQEAILNVFVDATVTAGQQYQYTIEALAYSGQQTLSPNVPVTASDCGQPAPSSFTLTVTTTCTKRDQRIATLSWQAVPGVTSYTVVTRDKGVDPGLTLPITLGLNTTSTSVTMRADTTWQIYAFTPAGIVKSNKVSQRYETCQTPILPPTVAASGTARFSVTGLPAGASWDRLRFPELTLNGGRVTASIEGRIPPADPSASGVTPSVPLFELTDTNATIDLGQVPSLASANAFTLVLALSSDPTQQQTPRVPKIVVTATPPPPPPAPTVRLTATVADDATTFVLRNTGPGSIELANTAPFTVSTPTGETVYAPSATTEVMTLAAGQTRSWRWDYKQTDGTPVERPGQFVVTLTYRFAGQERRIETEFVASRNPDDGSTFNVSRYGAACDGTADDTNAISQAIDAAITAHGGVVVFPAGQTCRLSGVRRSATGLTRELMLDGNGVTLLSTQTADTAGMVLGIAGSNVTIQNFTIRFEHAFDFARDETNMAASAIYVGQFNGRADGVADTVVVRNTTVEGSWYACIFASSVTNLTIEKNTCSKALATGIFTGSLRENITVRDNVVRDTRDAGIFLDSGPADTTPQAKVRISGNTIQRSSASGIGISGAKDVQITHNTVTQTRAPGIVIESYGYQSTLSNTEVTIRDNTVRDAGQYQEVFSGTTGNGCGIFATRTSDRGPMSAITIERNTVENGHDGGLCLSGIHGLTMADNTVSSSNGSGMTLGLAAAPDRRSVTNYTLTGNTITHAAASGIVAMKTTDGTIRNNTIRDYGRAGGAIDAGIQVIESDVVALSGNQIANTNRAEETVRTVDSQNVTDDRETSGTNATPPVSTPNIPPAVSQGLTQPPATSPPASTSTKPAQPTKLVGTAQSQTAVSLSWQDNATDEISYVVERRLTTCRIKRIRIVRWRFKIERTCPEFAAVTTLPAGSTSYTDSGLVRNTLYEYRVKAKNMTDESDASTTVRVRTKR